MYSEKALLDNAVADAMHSLGRMDQDMADVLDDFDQLVRHANNLGNATISATLYKLIADGKYFREVAPNIVAALGELA